MIEGGESCDCLKKGFGVFSVYVGCCFFFVWNVCVCFEAPHFFVFLFERDMNTKLHIFWLAGKDAGEHHILSKYILVIRHTQIKYIKYDFNISSETYLKNSVG